MILFISASANADDYIELESMTIKGNNESPSILYIVPWKKIKQPIKDDQKIVPYSLFKNVFDPVLPEAERSGDVISKD